MAPKRKKLKTLQARAAPPQRKRLRLRQAPDTGRSAEGAGTPEAGDGGEGPGEPEDGECAVGAGAGGGSLADSARVLVEAADTAQEARAMFPRRKRWKSLQAPELGDGAEGASSVGSLAGARDGRPPDDAETLRYYGEYAYMYQQMDMLVDAHRTGSYYNAILGNPSSFRGKVVLDVGAGSGILSIMAARAGAARVFAVEATDMAQRARRIVAANGLSEVVHVLQGTVETVELPCKVDVIVSEWMGYMLFRESMLDSVLAARDRFLRPGGAMFPSHATLYLAPVEQHQVLKNKWQTWLGEQAQWKSFAEDMKCSYDTDFACVEQDFLREQRKFYLQTGALLSLSPQQLAGPGRPLMLLELARLTLDDWKRPTTPMRCSMQIARTGPIEGFTGYFDVVFRGSEELPAEQEIMLTTAPSASASTHWGQQLFGFFPPMVAKQGDVLVAIISIGRQAQNHRLLRIEATFSLYGAPPGRPSSAAEPAKHGTLKEQRVEEYFVD